MKARFLILCCFGVLPAAAQFSSLATTHDGSVLFFTTPLSQSGTDQPGHGKVFIVDSRGVRSLLVRERECQVGTYPPGAYATNAYDMVAVSTSGDISRLAVTGLYDCSGYTAGLCVAPDVTDVYDASGAKTLTEYGHIVISRNGQWGLVTKDHLAGGTTYNIVDFTMQRKYVGPFVLGAANWRQGIADNGAAVIAAGDRGVSLFRPGTTPETIPELRGTEAAIDARASTAVTTDPSLYGLSVVNLTAVPPAFARFKLDAANPQISAQGTVIVFHSPVAEQAYLMAPDGSGLRQVTDEPEGIREEVLSGNGKVLWVVTNTGRLLQLFLDSGEKRELIGPVRSIAILVSAVGTLVLGVFPSWLRDFVGRSATLVK